MSIDPLLYIRPYAAELKSDTQLKECPACGESFQLPLYMKRHARTAHQFVRSPADYRSVYGEKVVCPQLLFLCPVDDCKRSSKEAALNSFKILRQHYIRVHTADRPFVCDHCQLARFALLTDKLYHQRKLCTMRPQCSSPAGDGINKKRHSKSQIAVVIVHNERNVVPSTAVVVTSASMPSKRRTNKYVFTKRRPTCTPALVLPKKTLTPSSVVPTKFRRIEPCKRIEAPALKALSCDVSTQTLPLVRKRRVRRTLGVQCATPLPPARSVPPLQLTSNYQHPVQDQFSIDQAYIQSTSSQTLPQYSDASVSVDFTQPGHLSCFDERQATTASVSTQAPFFLPQVQQAHQTQLCDVDDTRGSLTVLPPAAYFVATPPISALPSSFTFATTSATTDTALLFAGRTMDIQQDDVGVTMETQTDWDCRDIDEFLRSIETQTFPLTSVASTDDALTQTNVMDFLELPLPSASAQTQTPWLSTDSQRQLF